MRTRSAALALPLSLSLSHSLALAACGDGGAGADPPGQEVRSGKARETAPEVRGDERAALVAGGNDFAIRLYHEVAGGEDNLVYSPLSMSTAFAMLYAGARGDTEAQMAAALGYTLPQDRLHPAMNWLDLELSARPDIETGAEAGEPFELRVDNRMWGQKGFELLPAFLDTLATSYGAGMQLFDFANQAEEARLAINEWVAERTDRRILDLLPSGMIDGNTRLVLTNAVYFTASWKAQFDEGDTRPASFQTLTGSTVTVPTMRRDGAKCFYAAGDGYVLAELPYLGDQVAMTLLVPDAGRFSEIEASLTGESLESMFAALGEALLDISLPRFETELALDLPAALRALGMIDAFGDADFSGMSAAGGLSVKGAVHKAFIRVDERGTEAAAATGVVENVSAPPISAEVVVDRPFLYFVRDRVTGAILFVGRVTDPS